MDPVFVEGLPQEQVLEAAQQFLMLVRDYFSGRVFAAKPAYFRKSWRRRWIDASGWTLCLDKQAQLLERVKVDGQDRYSLKLSDFGRHEGRYVPRQLAIEGPGFRLAIEFQNVKIEL